MGFVVQDHQLFNISGGLGALEDDAEGLSYYELQLVTIVVAFTDPCLLRLHEEVVYCFLQLVKVLKLTFFGSLRR